ncbi:MAG: ParB/RepB/Spo0J family partition protein [Deltaproteobacteria bacterium]|nr:ParB/RepB/Spo0J family partition protein [Deltaproteobacteria bacterium]
MVTTDTAAASRYEKGQLYQIPLTDLQADPNQPRKSMDPQALEDLAASIAQHGVLTPILFRHGVVESSSNQDHQPEPILYVVAGERRCEAAKKAGLMEVPAILTEGKYGEIALVENLLRQDLTAVEEAEALDRLMKEEGYTQEQLGVIIGKARTTVTDILTLTRLPQEIRDECRGNPAVTRKTLIAIARKKQTRGMVTAWNKVKEKQAKEEAGGQRKERTALTPAAQCEWVDKANVKLAAIDSAAWTEEEQTAFAASLGELKKTILALLKTKPTDLV